MKKSFLLLFVLCLPFIAKAQAIDAFINDNDGQYTNIRNAPKGNVVSMIPTSHIVSLCIEKPKNGWWQICGIDDMDENLDEMDSNYLKGSKTGYWIHYSVLAIGTRNYGGETLRLRRSPAKSAPAVYSFSKEIVLMPIDVKGTWVKVKTADGKYTGWIEEEWLCGNPVTNCC